MSPEVFIQLIQLGATGLLGFMLWAQQGQLRALIEAQNKNQALLIQGLLGLLADGRLPDAVAQMVTPGQPSLAR